VRRHRDLDPQPPLTPHEPSELTRRLEAEARRIGFDAVGIADLRASEHADFYREWLAAGYHGDMEYLARPDAVARRADPGRAGSPCGEHDGGPLVSAVVVALHYDPAVDDQDQDPATGIIARYARSTAGRLE
jgi:epoxyqueuosine reductase